MTEAPVREAKGEWLVDVSPTEITLWLLLGLPETRCCNCGRDRVPLEDAIIPLVHERLVQELRAGVRAPHCAECIVTAARIPPRAGRLLGLFPVLFLVSTMLLVGAAHLLGVGQQSGDAHFAFLLLGAVVLSLAAIVALGRRKKPVGAQHTAYAAIRIRGVDVSLLGKVKAVTLAFANEAFAREAATALDGFRNAGLTS